MHWTFSYEDGSLKFGKCNNAFAVEAIRVVQEQDVEDIFTEQYFGCVWHRAHNNIVADLTKEEMQ